MMAASTDVTLPIIDLTGIFDATQNPKFVQETSQQLRSAMMEFGFFYIKGHGINSTLIDQLEEVFHNFFQLPLEEKRKIRMELAGLAWRGWFPLHGEFTSGKRDRKEGYYFGTECEDDSLEERLMRGRNLWPEKCPKLKGLLLQYLDELRVLAQNLLSLVSLALGLEREYFLKRFTQDPTILFRAFIYPPMNEANPNEWGVGEHTDMGFLTILKQDACGGLEVYSKNHDKWIEALPIENTFVVNIGDMLERWTHGIFIATPHRVRNATKKVRLSMPFFFDPEWNCKLEPIPTELLSQDLFNKQDNIKSHRWDGLLMDKLDPNLTYGEFVDSKITKCFPFLRKHTKENS